LPQPDSPASNSASKSPAGVRSPAAVVPAPPPPSSSLPRTRASSPRSDSPKSG